MLVAGSLLALFCGVANSAAAALEKRESVRADPAVAGLRLLVVLIRRIPWVIAMILSALAWLAEAAALALAPVPVVVTLRSSGRGLLVAGGSRWLDEQFSRTELAAVALATAGGIVTAIGATGSAVVRAPLGLPDQAAVAVLAALLAVAVSRWRGGVAHGAAVGVLFAATGVFTKEIGDRFATDGLGAILPLLASLGPWMMIAMSVWAQSLLQGAFRKANAATVAAANASVASLGLVLAGFFLYGEPFPRGWRASALVVGITVGVTGTVLLALASGRATKGPSAGSGAGENVAPG